MRPVRLRTGDLTIRHYWTLPQNRPQAGADGESLADEAATLIEESVRLRLVADAPVGILFVRRPGFQPDCRGRSASERQSGGNLYRYLAGSPLDEAHHAGCVARHFGTRHHVLPIGDAGLSLLDGLAPMIDEPIAELIDSSRMDGLRPGAATREGCTRGRWWRRTVRWLRGLHGKLARHAAPRKVPGPALHAAAAAASFLPAGMHGRNRIASLRRGPLQQMIWGRP